MQGEHGEYALCENRVPQVKNVGGGGKGGTPDRFMSE